MITHGINAVMANNYRNNIKAKNNKQKQNFAGKAVSIKATKAPKENLGSLILGLFQKIAK